MSRRIRHGGDLAGAGGLRGEPQKERYTEHHKPAGPAFPAVGKAAEPRVSVMPRHFAELNPRLPKPPMLGDDS